MSIFQDWAVNKGNVKGRLVLFLFRLACLVRKQPKILLVFCLPYLVLYRVLVEWILGVELPWNLKLGPNARVFHGQALVVSDRAVIGRSVILRHSTTIGVSRTGELGVGEAPVIGDEVDVGSNVVIIGKVFVGDRAVIGAGSVVIRDVPPRCVVAGNPARVIRCLDE